MAHCCSTNTRRLRRKDGKLLASLRYVVSETLFHKKKKNTYWILKKKTVLIHCVLGWIGACSGCHSEHATV